MRFLATGIASVVALILSIPILVLAAPFLPHVQHRPLVCKGDGARELPPPAP
jgi:hypothetical protein